MDASSQRASFHLKQGGAVRCEWALSHPQGCLQTTRVEAAFFSVCWTEGLDHITPPGQGPSQVFLSRKKKGTEGSNFISF